MKNLYPLLDSNEKTKIIFLLFILLHGIIELTSIASILPFMSLVMEPEIINSNSYLNSIYIYFKFINYDDFLIATGLLVFALLALSNAYSAFIYWWITRFVQFQSYRLSKKILSNYLFKPYFSS